MTKLTEEQLKKDALKRAAFKRHFMIYLVVIAFLWVIWAVTGSGYIWPVWPTGGWGIGILVHYFRIKKEHA